MRYCTGPAYIVVDFDLLCAFEEAGHHDTAATGVIEKNFEF